MKPRAIVPCLLLLSGFAGLGYQIVWIRLLAVGLGHEAVAMLSVVAGFFAGVALGGAALDRAVARSPRPGRIYAALEIFIGLWALALIWLAPPANAALADLIGPDPSALRRWAVGFFGPALLLGPATAAMGATLPAAERLHARLVGSAGHVGALYAANTLGAAAGAGLTLGLIAPRIGFDGALIVFAAMNFLAAAGALLGPARGEAARTEPAALPPQGRPRALTALLFGAGLLGVGVEVALTRALAQSLENTVYSFAAALTVYLIGATLGGALYQRRGAGRWGRGATALLLWALAAATFWSALAALAAGGLYPDLRAALGGFAAEILIAAIAFGPATLLMGAQVAHLAQQARRPEGGLGRALAVNLIGGAAAPF
ncbi:MAG: hypothetical protein ACK5MQ_08925, partial [Pikeienuella sp.]